MTPSNPATFTYSIVVFHPIGGMLFSLDQSLIGDANLPGDLPVDLGLSSSDNSLVNADREIPFLLDVIFRE
ncbi:unnamed protein product [Penicillium crustosum]